MDTKETTADMDTPINYLYAEQVNLVPLHVELRYSAQGSASFTKMRTANCRCPAMWPKSATRHYLAAFCVPHVHQKSHNSGD